MPQWIFLTAVVFLNFFSSAKKTAELVLLSGFIDTVNPDNPTTKDLVVTGNKVSAVCRKESEAKKQFWEKTRVVNLGAEFVPPGIIDAHVHFNRAGALINAANLMTVSSKKGLRKEIKRAGSLYRKENRQISLFLTGIYSNSRR